MSEQDLAYDTAEAILGPCARMLCGSKITYFHAHPDNVVVFNGNVCIASGKIWFGDLDVTLDEDKLQKLANTLGEKVYVLREHDARFDRENDPNFNEAVRVFASGE